MEFFDSEGEANILDSGREGGGGGWALLHQIQTRETGKRHDSMFANILSPCSTLHFWKEDESCTHQMKETRQTLEYPDERRLSSFYHFPGNIFFPFTLWHKWTFLKELASGGQNAFRWTSCRNSRTSSINRLQISQLFDLTLPYAYNADQLWMEYVFLPVKGDG